MVRGLFEAVAGVWGPLQYANQGDRLEGRIRDTYRDLYQRNGQALVDNLGGAERFRLQATWKQREIGSYARNMARSLAATNEKRRGALDAWVEREIAAGTRPAREIRAEAAQKWANWLQYKQQQMDGILGARATLEAHTDILVHSGLVDPARDRIMFFGGSPAPCPDCAQVAAGNPYTIAEARAIGGVVHPNCRDFWMELIPSVPGARAEESKYLRSLGSQWKLAPAQLEVARQKVRDGSVRLWHGQSRTPATGRAVDKEARLRQMRDPWNRIPGYVAQRAARRTG